MLVIGFYYLTFFYEPDYTQPTWGTVTIVYFLACRNLAVAALFA